MQEIQILISPDGKATVHVTGVKGKRCFPLTEELLNSLGPIVNDEKTADYFDDPEKEFVRGKERSGR